MPDGRVHIHTDVDAVEYAKFKALVTSMDGKLNGRMGERLDDALRLFNQKYTNLSFSVNTVSPTQYDRTIFRADKIKKFKNISSGFFHHKNYPYFHPLIIPEMIKEYGVIKDNRAIKFYLHHIELYSELKDMGGSPFTIRDVSGYVKWVKKNFK